jgi:predicted TIM-barrel fold metal-dependent hydrolase
MRLFDFSLLVGSDPYSPAEASQDALVAYLDLADAGGMVTSLAGCYYDCEAGNRETLEICDCDRRLMPGFVVDPRHPGVTHIDFGAAAGKFRAVVLFANLQPGIAQNWPLSHPALPAIFEKASEAKLPIIVYISRAGDVGALVRLANDADVPVVALGLSYIAVNEAIEGALAVENLLFGMSIFAGLDNIETLVGRLGPERLVYNSGEARWSHGGVLKVLETARIDDAARKRIAIGNARRIFGETF